MKGKELAQDQQRLLTSVEMTEAEYAAWERCDLSDPPPRMMLVPVFALPREVIEWAQSNTLLGGGGVVPHFAPRTRGRLIWVEDAEQEQR